MSGTGPAPQLFTCHLQSVLRKSTMEPMSTQPQFPNPGSQAPDRSRRRVADCPPAQLCRPRAAPAPACPFPTVRDAQSTAAIWADSGPPRTEEFFPKNSSVRAAPPPTPRPHGPDPTAPAHPSSRRPRPGPSSNHQARRTVVPGQTRHPSPPSPQTTPPPQRRQADPAASPSPPFTHAPSSPIPSPWNAHPSHRRDRPSVRPVFGRFRAPAPRRVFWKKLFAHATPPRPALGQPSRPAHATASRPAARPSPPSPAVCGSG